MLEAPINYLVPMTAKPTYFLEPPSGMPEENMRYDNLTVAIRNARSSNPPASIDREGFELVTHHTAVSDLHDQAAILSVYYREVEQLVKQATAASAVVAFDWNIRSSVVRGNESGVVVNEVDEEEAYVPEQVQPPVRSAHNDYTDLSGPQRVRDVMGDSEARELLKHRFAIINVWKPINGPVLQVPLAVCDARTISPGELVDTDLVYADRTGEISMLTYNPNQRWYYVPEMRTEEAMLLKCYDSEHNRVRFTAHSAFDDPTSAVDAPPRESIEIRTLVFF